MQRELSWDSVPVKRFPRFWIRQYVVFMTFWNWRQMQPWDAVRLEIRGFQKRTFLHE